MTTVIPFRLLQLVKQVEKSKYAVFSFIKFNGGSGRMYGRSAGWNKYRSIASYYRLDCRINGRFCLLLGGMVVW